MEAKVDWVVKEKGNIEFQLKELLEQKENLDVRLKAVNEHFVEVERNFELGNVICSNLFDSC